MSNSPESSKPILPTGEIDLVLRSTTSAWGPLACIGHEGDVEPGDWWGAFWWAMEQRLEQRIADQQDEAAEEPETKQTTLTEVAAGD